MNSKSSSNRYDSISHVSQPWKHLDARVEVADVIGVLDVKTGNAVIPSRGHGIAVVDVINAHVNAGTARAPGVTIYSLV